jgi:hypothetical protein
MIASEAPVGHLQAVDFGARARETPGVGFFEARRSGVRTRRK